MRPSSQASGSLVKTPVWALLVASMVLGLFTFIAMRQVGVPGLGLGVALMASAGWFVVLASGAFAQKALAQTIDDGELTFALAAGVVLSSIVVLGLSELFQITAAASFVVFGISVVILLLAFRRHFSWRFSGLGSNILILPCCTAFTMVWCWGSLTSVGQMPKTGTISLWTDIFIHATTILQYGDFWTSNRGSIEFANAARPLYHYGSYVLPAALLPVVDISGLQAAVGLHLPLGILAMFAGTHALAKRISADSHASFAGFLCICLLFIVPDTSTYGLANGWFGVRWMLVSSPGSGYGIAGVLISLIFLKTWTENRSAVALVGTIFFAVAVFQLRAHMLIWYLPVFVFFVASEVLPWSSRIRESLGFSLALFLFALPFANISRYLWFVHVSNEPTDYLGLYPTIVEAVGHQMAAPLGFLLLYPGMLGALIVVYPFLLFLARRTEKLQTFDWLPLISAAVAGLIIIWAPASSNGDQFEFKHRAFVLLYVATIIWSGSLAVRFAFQGFSATTAHLLVLLPVAGCTILTLSSFNQFMHAEKPKFQWGKQYVDTFVSKDLLAVADFVRPQVKTGDVALVLPVDTAARAADNATRFASVANIPLYISRYTMWEPKLAAERLAVAKQIGNAKNQEELNSALRKNGFRWLILNTVSALDFDPNFNHAVFKQGEWFAYMAI